MKVREYVENLLNESTPSWIRHLSLDDLKNYEKDHPGAKKETLNYIQRELYNRQNKAPAWLTAKHKTSVGYVDKTGKKWERYSVNTEYGKEKEFVEKNGKKIDVFPVYIEKKGNREFSHYEDDVGNKYNKDDVKKERIDRKYVPAGGYGNREGKEDIDVEEIFRDYPNINQETKSWIIRSIGKDKLSQGIEVIEKEKLSRKPYSDGTVFVFGDNGKYEGKFEGSYYYGSKYSNRKQAIAGGKKFIYVPGRSDFNSKDSEISRNKLRSGGDELVDKSKTEWGRTSTKDYYTSKLSAYKQQKYSKDIDEKLPKVEANLKNLITKDFETSLENFLNGKNYSGKIELDEKLQKRIYDFAKFKKLHKELKEKGKFDYTHEADKYKNYLKQLGF